MRPISVIQDNLILEELKSFPLQAVIWGILEENNKGQIFELSDKSILILETASDDPFVFIAGPVTARAIEETISHVSYASYPTIYCQPKHHHLFLEKNWDFLLRAEMHLEQNFVPKPIQNGSVIEPIESIELFKKCYWFEETSARYGSPEQFLKFGKGYALCREGKILSEAYADYIGGGYIEIGIVTHPDYQSQGFGSQVASHLLMKCLEQNYVPGWSCQINNRASMRVAIKIGFSISRYYVQMVPDSGNTLGQPLVKWLRENPDWKI
jgi:RimJ/RimL family protein N-acetyltransferase